MTQQKKCVDVNDALKDLVCAVSEEWGEAVKAINNYRFGKGTSIDALDELAQTFPPMVELYNVLRREK